MAREGIPNEAVLSRFRFFVKRGRLAHAYILSGPRGSGKFATAAAIARMLQCGAQTQRPCGACTSCRRIDAGSHPDVLVCDQGDDESIKISKVRELIHRMQLRPYEGLVKVVIIRGADLLTTEAANAFLKTLEEPSADNVLLLTAASLDRLPDTVRSRCQLIHLPGESVKSLAARLSADGSMNRQEANFAAGFSEGCYGKADDLCQDGFISWKNEIIDRFLSGQADEKFLKPLVSDSRKARAALEILLFCFKDMLFLKIQNGEGRVTNADRLADLKKSGARYSAEQLKDILAGVVSAKKMLDENLNIKIPFILLREKIWISS